MTKRSRPETPLYPKHHKAWDLEPYFGQHMAGLTAEALESKDAIAEQLAWRDKRIAELEQQLRFATPGGLAKLREEVLAHDFETGQPAEWLFCPRHCTVDHEPVKLVPGQRCPECREVADP